MTFFGKKKKGKDIIWFSGFFKISLKVLSWKVPLGDGWCGENGGGCVNRKHIEWFVRILATFLILSLVYLVLRPGQIVIDCLKATSKILLIRM